MSLDYKGHYRISQGRQLLKAEEMASVFSDMHRKELNSFIVGFCKKVFENDDTRHMTQQDLLDEFLCYTNQSMSRKCINKNGKKIAVLQFTKNNSKNMICDERQQQSMFRKLEYVSRDDVGYLWNPVSNELHDCKTRQVIGRFDPTTDEFVF